MMTRIFNFRFQSVSNDVMWRPWMQDRNISNSFYLAAGVRATGSFEFMKISWFQQLKMTMIYPVRGL